MSRGPAVPAINGAYIYADFCVGTLIAVDDTHKPTITKSLDVTVDQPTSFGEDQAGDLYVISRTGVVWKIIAA